MKNEKIEVQAMDGFTKENYFEYLRGVAITCLQLGLAAGIKSDGEDELGEMASSLYRIGAFITEDVKDFLGEEFDELEMKYSSGDNPLKVKINEKMSAVIFEMKDEDVDEKETECSCGSCHKEEEVDETEQHFYKAIETLNETVANLFKYQMDMKDDWKEGHQKRRLSSILEDSQRLVTTLNGFKYMYYGDK